MMITSATIKEKLRGTATRFREYRPAFTLEAPDAISRRMGFSNWDELNKFYLFSQQHSNRDEIGTSAAGMLRKFVMENDPDDLQRTLSEYIYLHTALKVFYSSLDGLRILQLACNYGPYLHFLQHQEGASVSGIDIAKAAVNYARDNGIDVRFGRADELPFKNEEFDAVVSKNFVCPYYVDKFELDTPRIISDIYRVLKPGGRYFSYNEIFLFERNKAVPPFASAQPLGPEFTTASRWFSMLTVLEKPAHN